MLALLMLSGLAAIAALIGFVIVAYGRGNQVGKFRAALVQVGDRCPCGGTVVARHGDYGDFLGCTRYRNGHGCLRVWHISGRRFFGGELHRRWAA
jgi:hypothetical protein